MERAYTRLPVGVLSRCLGTEPALEFAMWTLSELCLAESHDVLWLCASPPSDWVRKALWATSRRVSAHDRPSVRILLACEPRALPDLLLYLISAQVAPIILCYGPMGGVCPTYDERVAILSHKLPRLCLMAGVTVLMFCDEGDVTALSGSLARRSWSECALSADNSHR